MSIVNTLTRSLMLTFYDSVLSDSTLQEISKGVLRAMFNSDFLPKNLIEEKENNSRSRAEEARLHITQASSIIDSIREDLDTQVQQLNKLIDEIESKKKSADHYSTLVRTNQEEFTAFRKEMEQAITEQLVKQANKNKHLRMLLSFTGWFITLVLGAAVGYYFPQIANFFNSLLVK